MARLVITAVMDAAVGSYNRPFFVPTTGFANRSFADEVNRVAADNPMNAHPSDYSLWYLGEFDDVEGTFHPTVPPVLLSKAVDVIVKS